MPSITNIGGSITSAAILTLLAWGVRFLRAQARKNQQNALGNPKPEEFDPGRYFTLLTSAAFRMLVETDPIPHLLVDVSSAKGRPDAPLPKEFKPQARIPAEEIGSALTSDAAWQFKCRDVPRPTKGHLLVFVGDDEQQARTAASGAASAGYQRTAILQGGVQDFNASSMAQVHLKYINQDAMAALLGLAGPQVRARLVPVIDLRRHDERTLYGSIPGTVHVPADELGAALRLSPEEWRQSYGSDKPGLNDPVVMQSRTNRRSSWAAQVAYDAGYCRVLVYRQGVYGWRLHHAVKAYRSYEKWEAPPEPESFQVERLDVSAAIDELASLGLLA